MKGKIALVTGGARGIGKAIAAALVREGASVIIFDRLAADASQNIRAVQGDVSSEADVLKLFKSIEHLDIAVNCAGVQLIRPLVETTAEEFDWVTSINLRGTFLVGREAAKKMIAQPPGSRIINIASELAYCGRSQFSAYTATKGGIISMTRSWARELAPHILVNAVAPGPTDTAMINEEITPQQIREEIASVPLGRLAQPEEIAGAVVFLAGEGGKFFTGQCISPSGGAVML
jgi:3-oxoacyl-[acyl-carrier protein] reductase